MKKIAFIFAVGALLGAVALENIKYATGEAPIVVALLPDGASYSGDMENGVFEGEGLMRWNNGGQYSGRFSQGLFNGRGEYIFANGNRYEGQFKNGYFHGEGRFEFNAGGYYEGQFRQDEMQGKGTMVYADGSRYEGEFVRGMAEGEGKLVTETEEYTGQFSGDLYEGAGTLKYSSGSEYSGDFQQGNMDGQGVFTTEDGSVYQGEFVEGNFTGQGTYRSGEVFYQGAFENWLFQGEGELQDEKGNQFIGNFSSGQLQGQGKYIGKDGATYTGEFEYGMYNGEGTLALGSGDTYQGHFQYGQYHGTGTLTYANPLDGVKTLSGRWRNGELVEPDDPEGYITSEAAAELALYNQSQLLAEMDDQLLPSAPSTPNMYFLGIAGSGSQGVFRREVSFVKDLFDTQYGTAGRSLVLINSRETVNEIPLATKTSTARALDSISRKMDADNDILFIYMSSHGSNDFEFSLHQPGLTLPDLPAATLAEMLESLPVRWKVIVISACYSGGFIPQLKNDNTLIITAASAENRSFGCSDRAEFTYFGEAFFKDALPSADNFVEAFEQASKLIAEREESENFKHSEPQISKPADILKQLDIWREHLQGQGEDSFARRALKEY